MTQSQVHYSQSDKMTCVIAALYTHEFNYFTYETKCTLHLCQYNWINDSTTHCCSYCKLLYHCNVLIMITTTWWIGYQQLMCNLWILLVVLDLYQSVNTALYENTDTNKNRGSVLAGACTMHICCTTHKNVKKISRPLVWAYTCMSILQIYWVVQKSGASAYFCLHRLDALTKSNNFGHT